MLIPERAELMRWIVNQSHAVSRSKMESGSAPGYDFDRIDQMREEGLLARHLDIEDDEIAGLYTVTDKGRALLAEYDEALRKESEALSQQKFQNRISIIQVVVPVLTFIMGLLIEHFSGIVGLIEKCFS